MGWVGWDLCVGLLSEHRFAVLIKTIKESVQPSRSYLHLRCCLYRIHCFHLESVQSDKLADISCEPQRAFIFFTFHFLNFSDPLSLGPASSAHHQRIISASSAFRPRVLHCLLCLVTFMDSSKAKFVWGNFYKNLDLGQSLTVIPLSYHIFVTFFTPTHFEA